jgi:hypothetical protein
LDQVVGVERPDHPTILDDHPSGLIPNSYTTPGDTTHNPVVISEVSDLFTTDAATVLPGNR